MAVTHPKTPDGFADGMHFHIQYHGMPDEHAHPGFCEMLFVLSGKLAHTVNGEEETQPGVPEDENLDPDAGKSQRQVIDEITGQLSLFGDDEPQD